MVWIGLPPERLVATPGEAACAARRIGFSRSAQGPRGGFRPQDREAGGSAGPRGARAITQEARSLLRIAGGRRVAGLLVQKKMMPDPEVMIGVTRDSGVRAAPADWRRRYLRRAARRQRVPLAPRLETGHPGGAARGAGLPRLPGPSRDVARRRRGRDECGAGGGAARRRPGWPPARARRQPAGGPAPGRGTVALDAPGARSVARGARAFGARTEARS
jgi:hypothetical protein